MRVLVVGSGGREHALAWSLAKSPEVSHVFVAPGNAGTTSEINITNVDISADDTPNLSAFAHEKKIDMTVIGPEGPLVAGIIDHFESEGLRCFGPTRGAAQLEGSKAYCKDFMQRHGIPTAAYQNFTEVESAITFADELDYPVVIKASGLAAGKGVIIAADRSEALAALQGMLNDQSFGDAGAEVVVEAFLQGEEASFIVLASGTSAIPLASSQDHKARDDGDRGPNTGGMGAYSPAPVVTPSLHDRVMRQVIMPTLEGLASEGNPFTGFLYAGIMVSAEGDIGVLEFNVRFGDPETQPILMRLQSSLYAALDAALTGELDELALTWDTRSCLGVVMAAGGYPERYEKGVPIKGLVDLGPDAKVFHAGTQVTESGEVVTSGGRVLCVCALGPTLEQAQADAYAAVDGITWDDEYHRGDIGYRALQ